tara:strand:- start:129634 stop:130128 length:495 start_codon:yes stop_codon:yes gene_type:complete
MPLSTIATGISGIFETHLPVRDLATSAAFYRDRIGLTLATEIPARNIAFFWVGAPEAGMLGLWGGSSAPLNMTLHFAFRASHEALLSACAALTKVGITPLGFNGEPVTEPVVLGWMPALSVYFKDPDGHSIEMLHLLPDAADAVFGTGPLSAWQSRADQAPKLP